MSWGGGPFSPLMLLLLHGGKKFTMKQMTTNVSFVLKNIKYTEKIMMAGMNQRKENYHVRTNIDMLVTVVRGWSEWTLHFIPTQCDALGDLHWIKMNISIMYISVCRCVSHLNSRADWRQRIHLGETDCLAINSWRLLDHDGGAGLALRPGRRWGVGWFGLRENTKKNKSI